MVADRRGNREATRIAMIDGLCASRRDRAVRISAVDVTVYVLIANVAVTVHAVVTGAVVKVAPLSAPPQPVTVSM